jgi:hypothetical protein
MLKKRWFERNGDEIKMFSQHDHSDVWKANYQDRMSGDKGYIDKEKDFMRVGRIPIAMWASLSNEQKHELETSPQALMKLLKNNPTFVTTTAQF